MRPEVTYDPEADALFIQLSESKPYAGADAGPLVLHYTEDGRVVAIEVLSAREKLAAGAWSKAPLPGTKEAKAHAAE